MSNFESSYFFWNRDSTTYPHNVTTVRMETDINKPCFETDYWVWIVMLLGVLLMICISIYIVVHHGNKCKNAIVLSLKLYIFRIFRWIKKTNWCIDYLDYLLTIITVNCCLVLKRQSKDTHFGTKSQQECESMIPIEEIDLENMSDNAYGMYFMFLVIVLFVRTIWYILPKDRQLTTNFRQHKYTNMRLIHVDIKHMYVKKQAN